MSTTMNTTTGETAAGRSVRGAALIGLLLIVFGAIMAVAGVVTWVAVGNELAAEKIVVSEDAARFAGQQVDTPWEAYSEAETIQKHAMETSGGTDLCRARPGGPEAPDRHDRIVPARLALHLRRLVRRRTHGCGDRGRLHPDGLGSAASRQATVGCRRAR